MTNDDFLLPDPQLDLVLERLVDVPPALVWAAWTEPHHLVKWFTPAPYTTVEAEVDLRPGGIFRTVMRSPEGEEYPNIGCYLEIVEQERLTFTSVLGPGFRPVAPSNGADDIALTTTISLTPEGDGTRYVALAKHPDPETAARHDEMGFQEGWGAALDQLVALAHDLRSANA